MATLILSGIGASIGGSITGMAIGAAVGKVAGSVLGGIIDNKLFGKSTDSNDKQIQELKLQTMAYGHVIPEVYGFYKLAGNIIWASSIREHSKNSSHRTSKFGPKHHHTSYTYTVSLVIAICHGPVSSLEKIWANQTEIDKNKDNIRFYSGNEQQNPDPLLEAFYGYESTPAYRGLSYIVLQDFDLTLFGNQIPTFVFEIRRSLESENDVEKMVEAVTMIPGSGEFVYDTKTQHYSNGDIVSGLFISRGSSTCSINQHHNNFQTNSIVSLEQLQKTLPNVKWISVVVCWFATSINAGECEVLPGVEERNGYTTPDEWKVSHWSRNTAYYITKIDNKVQYGGTVSDLSLVRYLIELRKQGFKIMLYPIIVVDTIDKPWRGRISGNKQEIDKFFTKYNVFISHYADLVSSKTHFSSEKSNLVDAFIIGSELVGLTTSQDNDYSFPAVQHLISLAKNVKHKLGEEVKVSYAADWSEYHNVNGYYHLDSLWSCDAIDFIGIDAYFPLTNAKFSDEITLTTIMNGWSSGEGYDYYITNNKNTNADSENNISKHSISSEWAWKNIDWWWNNIHINTDGKRTAWKPCSKKIWFTEYGFPSVSLATNQPNIFFDKSSSESGFPRFSDKKIDMQIQRLGIEATERYWKNSNIVERKFLWTWDARPYPTWPIRYDVWGDTENWARGHWVQGKLGCITLAKLIRHLLKDIIKDNDFDISSLENIPLLGIAFSQSMTLKSLLQTLQKVYGFYIFEKQYKLFFQLKSKPIEIKISESNIRNLNNSDNIQSINSKNHQKNLNLIDDYLYEKGMEYKISYNSTENIPNKVHFTFEKVMTYQQYTVQSKELENIQFQEVRTEATKNNLLRKNSAIHISLPIVLTESQGEQVANNVLQDYWQSRTIFSIPLSMDFINLEIGDIITHNNQKMQIISKDIGINKSIVIQAIPCSNISASFSNNMSIHNKYYEHKVNENMDFVQLSSSTLYEIFTLPTFHFEEKKSSHDFCQKKKIRIFIASCGISRNWPGSIIECEDQHVISYEKATIGKILSILPKSNKHLIDNKNEIIVNIIEGSLFSIKLQSIFEQNHLLNLALIDNEIICFQKAELVQPCQYKLSGLIRGLYCTKVQRHHIGARFILLNDAISHIDIDSYKENITLTISTLGDESSQKECSFNINNTECNNKTFKSEKDKKHDIYNQYKSCQILPPTDIIVEQEFIIQNKLNDVKPSKTYSRLKWINLDLNNEELFDNRSLSDDYKTLTILNLFDKEGSLISSEICDQSYKNKLNDNWHYALLMNKSGNIFSEEVKVMRYEKY